MRSFERWVDEGIGEPLLTFSIRNEYLEKPCEVHVVRRQDGGLLARSGTHTHVCLVIFTPFYLTGDDSTSARPDCHCRDYPLLSPQEMVSLGRRIAHNGQFPEEECCRA